MFQLEIHILEIITITLVTKRIEIKVVTQTIFILVKTRKKRKGINKAINNKNIQSNRTNLSTQSTYNQNRV